MYVCVCSFGGVPFLGWIGGSGLKFVSLLFGWRFVWCRDCVVIGGLGSCCWLILMSFDSSCVVKREVEKFEEESELFEVFDR